MRSISVHYFDLPVKRNCLSIGYDYIKRMPQDQPPSLQLCFTGS